LGAEVSAIRQFRDAARTVSFAVLTVVLATSGTRAEEACRFVTIGSATVRAVSDAGIALEDGRTLRLAGIEHTNSTDLPPGTALILKRLSAAPETDRYGRVNAHAFITDDGAEHWLQADLVSRGLARVSSRVGDPACARLLLAKEQAARAEKVGLWGEPVYVMGKAEDPAEVLKQRGRFALVEGKVLSVRESGGTIYVNFGRRWSEDFTVTIAKRNERAFSAAGLTPKSLNGRRVRIRGWIEERGGPWVEAARPEQIEILGN
jgi:Staphylococcal nuclease homologue